MKKLLILFSMLAFFISCDKDDEPTPITQEYREKLGSSYNLESFKYIKDTIVEGKNNKSSRASKSSIELPEIAFYGKEVYEKEVIDSVVIDTIQVTRITGTDTLLISQFDVNTYSHTEINPIVPQYLNLGAIQQNPAEATYNTIYGIIMPDSLALDTLSFKFNILDVTAPMDIYVPTYDSITKLTTGYELFDVNDTIVLNSEYSDGISGLIYNNDSIFTPTRFFNLKIQPKVLGVQSFKVRITSPDDSVYEFDAMVDIKDFIIPES